MKAKSCECWVSRKDSQTKRQGAEGRQVKEELWGAIGSGTILERKNSVSETDVWSPSTSDSVTSVRGKRVTSVLIQQLAD